MKPRSSPPIQLLSSGRGVTLIELLVVVGVLALLIALLLPTGRNIFAYSKNVGCIANLKQISVASMAYSADHNGAWPPNNLGEAKDPKNDPNGPKEPNEVFSDYLKPYLGRIPLRPSADFRRSPLVCPSDHRDIPDNNWNYQGLYAPLKYGLSYGQNSNLTSRNVNYQAGHSRALERPSQTVLYMDFFGNYLMDSFQLYLSAGEKTRAEYLSERHGGYLNAVFADGSVKRIALKDIPTTKPSLFWQGRED